MIELIHLPINSIYIVNEQMFCKQLNSFCTCSYLNIVSLTYSYTWLQFMCYRPVKSYYGDASLPYNTHHMTDISAKLNTYSEDNYMLQVSSQSSILVQVFDVLCIFSWYFQPQMVEKSGYIYIYIYRKTVQYTMCSSDHN